MKSRRSRALAILVMAVVVASASYAAKKLTVHIKGSFAFQLHPVTSLAPFQDGTAGKPNSGVATAPRQKIMRVGVFTADGKSNLVGRAISKTDDGVSSMVIDYQWTGMYGFSDADDGTGTLTMNAPAATNIISCVSGDGTPITGCEAFLGAETYAIVLSGDDKTKTMAMTQTDNAGGGAKVFLAGGARTQNSASSGGPGIPKPFPF